VTQPGSSPPQDPLYTQGSRPRPRLSDFHLVVEDRLVCFSGSCWLRNPLRVIRQTARSFDSSRSGRVTAAMTISRLAQRVPAPGLAQGTRPFTRHSPASPFQSHQSQPQSRRLRLSNRKRSLSTIRLARSPLPIARGAATTGAAACETGEVNTTEADFRRPASAAVGSAAPRRPTSRTSHTFNTSRGAPSVFSPTFGSRSTRSHTTCSALLRPQNVLVPAVSSRAFSSLAAAAAPAEPAAAAMAAAKIDGTAIARKVREQLRAEIAEKKGINPRFQPCLKIIQGALHPRHDSRPKCDSTNRQKNPAVGDRSDSCKPKPQPSDHSRPMKPCYDAAKHAGR